MALLAGCSKAATQTHISPEALPGQLHSHFGTSPLPKSQQVRSDEELGMRMGKKAACQMPGGKASICAATFVAQGTAGFD